MKKVKKSLSVILTAVIILMVFSIVPSAASMTKAEVLDHTYKVLRNSAAKEEYIKVNKNCKYSNTADFSPLSSFDVSMTKWYYGDEMNGTYNEEKETVYMAGKNSEYYEEFGVSEIENVFDRRYFLEDGFEYITVNKATVKNNADGSELITISSVSDFSDTNEGVYTETLKYYVDKNDRVASVIMEVVWKQSHASFLGELFLVTYEMNDVYNFEYSKVDAKKLVLNPTEMTLGYGDVGVVTYKIEPSNVTYTDVYCKTTVFNEDLLVWEENNDIVYAYFEDGMVYVEGLEEGIVDVDICTYSGELLESCTVTVEFTFFDRISKFFDTLFSAIFGL